MRLFWRVFWLNTLVFAVATVLLAIGPWTVSAPIRLVELAVLLTGAAALLAINAALLRWGLAPLDRLTRTMATVDLLQPGQRLPVTGSGEVAALIDTFNQMLQRLETERSTSSARALSAQEEERRRIAQELHDEIGQSLTAVLLELKRLTDRVPEPLREDVRYAQETIRDSLDEVRRIARRLRPGVLEDLGLASALTALTSQFSEHTGIRVRRSLHPDLPPLTPQVELVLYRIAQESLTNAARHSGAGAVELKLAPADGGVRLDITDDGRGLNGAPEGAGIRGMRERALLVGGRLTLESGPEGGTRVSLHVPTPPKGPQEGRGPRP
ncbi:MULTISPECIES: sensor histidine kinase [Thermomonospora]|uniref:histidine kinase n=1 Tax=Thermomonospora curvata (strain ATCC 19995 / DSM 43183 / JCM 3096 / KCTC 9072 / NBRC 15933 / NCIMB 10081 / Henssen B9) TaxID=471852 RepID=D1AEE4_THECD|nr:MULTISPECIES: HAMP domain-containing sensor histidine kinase [Thermomonospora]ACY95760.1 histidine kinase [Thermomonospora curvata DSM 43183]PKK16338.1 MAG: sensor histidine kinase [Thermomonospora sp. CIF 1]